MNNHFAITLTTVVNGDMDWLWLAVWNSFRLAETTTLATTASTATSIGSSSFAYRTVL